MKSLVVLKETHNILRSFPALIPLFSRLLDLQQTSLLDVVVASQSGSWNLWQLSAASGSVGPAAIKWHGRALLAVSSHIAHCRLSYYFRLTASPLSSFGSTLLLFFFACFAGLNSLLVLKWTQELKVLLIRNRDYIDCQVDWIWSQLREIPMCRSMRTFPGSINWGDCLLEWEQLAQGFQGEEELVLPLKCIDNHCLITWLLLCI